MQKVDGDYAANPLTFTGERFLPSARGELWSEHWHRYHYVLPFLTGKVVLDCASGEGYGTALMATVSHHVTGIDVAQDAVQHASAVYANVANCKFECASATALPIGNLSIDVVISFETIEHIDAAAQQQFMAEIARVLKPDGVLIMSSPNKAEYSDKRHFDNTFHVREMYAQEFRDLLTPCFSHQFWLGQKNQFVSRIEPMALTGALEATAYNAVESPEYRASPAMQAESITVSQAAPATVIPSLPPIYYVVLCAKSAAALASVVSKVRLSNFTDAEEWAYNDYTSAYVELNANRLRLKTLEAENAALAVENAALKAQIATIPTPASAHTPSVPDTGFFRVFAELLQGKRESK